MQSNYEYHPTWLGAPPRPLELSPDDSWEGPESRQESPGSETNKLVKSHNPYPDSKLSVKSNSFQPQSYSNNSNDYAPYSPHQQLQQQQLLYTPQQHHHQQQQQQQQHYPQNQLQQQQSPYDRPSSEFYRECNDSAVSLFSGMTYSSWIEQQQQDVSEDYASPQPQRSIWASDTSPMGGTGRTPKVHRGTKEDSDVNALDMTRLSLMGAASNSVMNGSKQQQRQGGNASVSQYSNIPGLVQASSESTTSVRTEPTWGGSKPPDHDSFQERMTSSLRSVLDDDEEEDDGDYDNGILASPSGPDKPTLGSSDVKSLRANNYKLGNSNTRRNRNRNRLRQQKKHEGKKTLKERNDNSSTTAGPPLSPRDDLKSMSPNLQQAVNRQAQGNARGTGNQSQDTHKNEGSSNASSEAIRMLMSGSSSHHLDESERSYASYQDQAPILPQQVPNPSHVLDFWHSQDHSANSEDTEDTDDILLQHMLEEEEGGLGDSTVTIGKKHDWLLRMNKKVHEIPVGELDPSAIPVSAIMNAWAKTKSAQGASMVELWLKRAQQEYGAGNDRIIPTTKMYTMAVDAWARSGERGAAANRAEALLHHMNNLYQTGGHDKLKPTTGIFNAVINAWARSREKIAPVRAEQILSWMENFEDSDIQPDKYTYNTVIHAWAKAGGTEAAQKAQQLLSSMDKKYQEGNFMAKPDTITYNVVINAWAKSGGRGAALEAEKLLSKMHKLHEMGDPDVKPSVVTYGAVIDAYAKSGEKGSAARADTLLAHMIQLHQSDPIRHADMLPNTYVFNTVINCWAKSKEHDAASKAEEMLVAMSRLHASGIPNLKPDAFTYTAVIDAWAKSGYRGAASRADQLLDKMEAKYLAGDADLKPNTFTYNAVINALAKSGEVGAAARAERVLQNMVNRYRSAGSDDVKPTTINFNTVLDAWAKSGGGRAAAERAEEILEWMDRLYKGGNADVKPDTITFNAVLDAWARSGDRVGPHRAEQILDHMDELYRAGNTGVKPDTYTYNTLINAWAKSGGRGAAARAEHVLSVMHKRYKDGDTDFKPNTRTHTSVIDAWAKSGEKGAARRAEQILNNMISHYEATGDNDVKPNVHTANAVCNACAFTKMDEDRQEAMEIAFRVFDWLSAQPDMSPDSYTYTILLSVCANLIPKEDGHTRYMHARAFFESCREAGHVNDYVLRKLRQTVIEDEYLALVDYRMDTSASSMPTSWTRNAKINNPGKGRKGAGGGGGWSNNRRRGK